LQTARKYRAAAGLSGCAILYSEDMQDGLNLQGPARAGSFTLSIRNPFSR
jgi:predicted nucleic acid-binding protein